VWSLPREKLKPKVPLSATQIESLFSCPLRWALQYVAKLYPASVASLPDHEQLVGSFAHRLLEDVLLDWARTHGANDPIPPEVARARAAAEFDRRKEGEAAPLLRPGREVEHDWARRTTRRRRRSKGGSPGCPTAAASICSSSAPTG
jgi:hypothetical protein